MICNLFVVNFWLKKQNFRLFFLLVCQCTGITCRKKVTVPTSLNKVRYRQKEQIIGDLIATKKEALNRQISDYISRAESLKRNKPVKVEFVERISIEEESVGYDYAAIFNRCLNDNISAVEIEDPFIIHHHQAIKY